MTDPINRTDADKFSTFWPLFVLLTALILSTGYQVYAANSQRLVYDEQFQAALPALNQAQGSYNRYTALMKDLIQSSSKDPAAADIVKAAVAAHLVQLNDPAKSAPAEPPAVK
jgi:hypothetical protein